ncbi:MAG: acetyltransferase, partial [Phycisphaerales bacterium]|nr:acetyltransferase [Phycisphaerales bacterium]
MTENSTISFLLAGAGGFGRGVYHWLCDYATATYGPRGEAWEVRGFLDDDLTALEGFSGFPPIVSTIQDYRPEPGDRVVLAIGIPRIRKAVVKKLLEVDATFETLIHPQALVLSTAKVGLGSIVGPFSTISDHAEVGDYALVNSYSSIGHDVKIGAFCDLCPHAALSGFARIDDDVFFGTSSVVVPGKSVGRGAQVAAGSTVVRNTRPYSFVQGVPGKEVRDFFPK